MNYYESYSGLGSLGDAYQVSAGVAAGAGVVSAAATTAVASGLITAGTTLAATVPVIGWVAGAIVVAAGFIAKAQGKAKAIRGAKNDVLVQNAELRVLNAELDKNINQVATSTANINGQIKAAGLAGVSSLNGLNGFGDFLQKVFTPAKYAEGQYNDATIEGDQLNTSINSKIKTLENMQSNLESLYKKLTTGKSTQTILLIGGGVLALSAVGYLIYSLTTSDK